MNKSLCNNTLCVLCVCVPLCMYICVCVVVCASVYVYLCVCGCVCLRVAYMLKADLMCECFAYDIARTSVVAQQGGDPAVQIGMWKRGSVFHRSRCLPRDPLNYTIVICLWQEQIRVSYRMLGVPQRYVGLHVFVLYGVLVHPSLSMLTDFDFYHNSDANRTINPSIHHLYKYHSLHTFF